MSVQEIKEKKPINSVFGALLRYALWRNEDDSIPQHLSHDQYLALKSLSQEQTTVGLISQALVDRNVRLDGDDVADVFLSLLNVQQLNQQLNQAVINLHRMMENQGIRILILKGQTYATFYPYPYLRQCGDIDFLCHPDDIDKAIAFLKYDLGQTISDAGSNKHASFVMDGIRFEIHRLLTNFAYPPNHHYWENIFMKEVWQHPFTISIDGYQIPSLAPTYNAVYVFEHIFFHLIMDGIGIRQFCDWSMLLHHYKDEIDKELLCRHLKSIGLYKAYTEIGKFLVDYLGLPEAEFPVEFCTNVNCLTDSLLRNVLYYGNFGHNVGYYSSRGPIHAIEHLIRIIRQGIKYCYISPKEIIWRIPYMLRWWTIRIVRVLIPCKSIQSVFNRI